jgi:hypothetical protein
MRHVEEIEERRRKEQEAVRARWANAKDCPPQKMMLNLECASAGSDNYKRYFDAAMKIFDAMEDGSDEQRDFCAFVGDKGQTVLHVALEKSAPTEVVKRIIRAYPDAAKIVDGKGRLPLHWAVNGFSHKDIHRDESDDERFLSNAKACLEAYPEAASVWTSQNGSSRRLPLHVAVEHMRLTLYRSSTTATSLVEMLLAAYPAAARQTGWAKEDKERAEAEAKGQRPRFKEEFVRRDLPVNLVLGEDEKERKATKEDPTFGPPCVAVHELLKPASPPDWNDKPSACVVS